MGPRGFSMMARANGGSMANYIAAMANPQSNARMAIANGGQMAFTHLLSAQMEYANFSSMVSWIALNGASAVYDIAMMTYPRLNASMELVNGGTKASDIARIIPQSRAWMDHMNGGSMASNIARMVPQ